MGRKVDAKDINDNVKRPVRIEVEVTYETDEFLPNGSRARLDNGIRLFGATGER